MDDVKLNPPSAEQPSVRISWWLPLALLGFLILSGVAGSRLAKWLRPTETGLESESEISPKFPNRLFKDWKKPDLVLLVSGQQYGYLLPCGCSRPQYGGLERRYNLLQLFKEAGWPYAAVDLGDVVQKEGIAHLPNQQALIKYRYTMRGLKEMGYAAVGIGESEVLPGLENVFAEYALRFPKPRVLAGNLIDSETNFPEMTKPWVQIDPPSSSIRLGVTSIVGPFIAHKIRDLTDDDKKLRFASDPKELRVALDRIVESMRGSQIDLPVLLYQGPVSRDLGKKPYTEAMACAEAYPQFPLVVALSEADDPTMRPYEVLTHSGSKSLVVTLGKKGRHVGVFGIWKTNLPNQPFDFKYERVELGEEFMTPEHQEKGHPIIDLIEGYTKELKDNNYLQKYGQVRHALQVMSKVGGLRKEEVQYAGSDVCKRCHEHAYDVWKKSGHSHAFKTLVDATRPGNRQYDPECIVCHVVGYGYLTGYVNEQATPKLKDVGCESCHGPSYVHVHNPDNKEWRKRINPWKYLPKDKRLQAMDAMCQKCHDLDNDVNWGNDGFKRKWPKVEHPTPEHEKIPD